MLAEYDIADELEPISAEDEMEDDLEITLAELEDDDDDDDDDGDEAEFYGERRRRGRRIRTAANRQHFVSRASRGAASRQQVRSSLSRVSKDIRRNAVAIKRVNSRVNGQSALNRRQSKALKAMKKDLADQKQLFLFLTLMGSGEQEYEVTEDVVVGEGAGALTVLEKGNTLKIKEGGDSTTKLLPLMMMGGFGDSGGGGLMSNPLMMIMFMDALK